MIQGIGIGFVVVKGVGFHSFREETDMFSLDPYTVCLWGLGFRV